MCWCLLPASLKRLYSGTFDIRRTQFPLWKDLKDFYFDFRYFLGFENSRPKMEKFMYKQKLHYLGHDMGLLSADTVGLLPAVSGVYGQIYSFCESII